MHGMHRLYINMILTLYIYLFSFYVHDCFDCTYVFVSHVCSAQEVRRRHWIFWIWSYRQLVVAMWVKGT